MASGPLNPLTGYGIEYKIISSREQVRRLPGKEVHMPLIILGLMVIIGISLYALVRYGQSDDRDTRPVRERYSDVFEKAGETLNEAADKIRKSARYTVVDEDGSDDDDDDGNDADSHVMHFPDDAELEKRKRNIH